VFHNVVGMCLMWDEEPAPGKVAQWKVHQMKLSRARDTSLSKDASTVYKFWKLVDEELNRMGFNG
jgi:RNA pol II accessory factor, Cdc73 family, C-terminal